MTKVTYPYLAKGETRGDFLQVYEALFYKTHGTGTVEDARIFLQDTMRKIFAKSEFKKSIDELVTGDYVLTIPFIDKFCFEFDEAEDAALFCLRFM